MQHLAEPLVSLLLRSYYQVPAAFVLQEYQHPHCIDKVGCVDATEEEGGSILGNS